MQPTIYGTKQLILQQHAYGNLKVYIDFHAHAGKRGGFMFGNSLKGPEQVENIMLAKLISMNSISFDFGECSFAEQNMTVKDKRDGLSREGAGRVAIYKDTGLPNCYTLECNYHNAKRLNYIPPKMDIRTQQIVPETPITDVRSKIYEGKKPPAYTPELYEDIGKAVGIGLLDYFNKNPISRLPMSTFKSLENMRLEISSNKSLCGTSVKRTGSGVLNERIAAKKVPSKPSGKKFSGPAVVFVSKKQKENGKREINEEILGDETEENEENCLEEAKNQD